VFPLRGKTPAIRNPHPKTSPERATCKGECGLEGHGVLDATTDVDTIIDWWSARYRSANIGGRLPETLFALDVDPRDNGDKRLAELIEAHGPLPDTLTTLTGSGGFHYFYRRPPGKLKSSVFGPKTGLDIKDHRGYVVLPPSIHPGTGKPYVGLDHPIADPPPWLAKLIRVDPAQAKKPAQHKFWNSASVSAGNRSTRGDSPADAFTDNTSWFDVLGPHGWACKSVDPDGDGAVWLHPTATSPCSATVRHGCLFVYSTNTPFEVTSSSDPHGYTRFRAYAQLNFNGDLSAAAKSLRKAAA
jgi:hypothetical protein